jgi:hypothetical protein
MQRERSSIFKDSERVHQVLKSVLDARDFPKNVSRYHLYNYFSGRLGAITFVKVPTPGRGRNRVVPMLTPKGHDLLRETYLETFKPKEASSDLGVTKRGRGRPKGSKNKPKVSPTLN